MQSDQCTLSANDEQSLKVETLPWFFQYMIFDAVELYYSIYIV